MLHIKNNRKKRSIISGAITALIVLLLVSGGYILLLTLSPNIPYVFEPAPIKVSEVPKPKIGINRVIIPKIGVNIPYGTDGKTSLDEGALWRYPDRGNPADGGNFIIAAHRFSIQPTPGGTVKASPFYHLDRMKPGDQIIIDYDGKRYGYEVTKTYDVKPTQIEIEARSEVAKMTLYSCELGGADAGRIVLEAKPVGQVTLKTD